MALRLRRAGCSPKLGPLQLTCGSLSRLSFEPSVQPMSESGKPAQTRGLDESSSSVVMELEIRNRTVRGALGLLAELAYDIFR